MTKKISKFIFYPILLSILGYILLGILTKHLIGNFDINSILLNSAPNFENRTKSIYVNASNKEDGNIDISEIKFPEKNQKYGEFEMEAYEITYPLIFGDDMDNFKSGVGQYPGSYIPGYGGTILVGGHNYMFKPIENVKLGDIIKITTSYGLYKYEVKDIKILNYDDPSAVTIQDKEEKLVFYTCYPFDALGSIKTRFFVYADYISGPKINR